MPWGAVFKALSGQLAQLLQEWVALPPNLPLLSTQLRPVLAIHSKALPHKHFRVGPQIKASIPQKHLPLRLK